MEYPIIPPNLKPSPMSPVRRWILESLQKAPSAGHPFGLKPFELRMFYKLTDLSKAKHGDNIYSAALVALVIEGCVAEPTKARPYFWYIKGLETDG